LLAKDESIDAKEKAERSEPAEAKLPTEKAEAAEPTDPMDKMDPTDPMDRMDPSDAIDKRDRSDQRDLDWFAMELLRPSSNPSARHRCRPVAAGYRNRRTAPGPGSLGTRRS
jgi:hypothetical protein